MASDPIPKRVEPMLAKLGELPSGDDSGWGFEVKWDGIRAITYLDRGELRIESRSRKQMEQRYPELSGLGEALADRRCVLDGEIVALDEHGRPSFQLLQRRMGVSAEPTIKQRSRETPATLMVFDLLHLDGRTLFDASYEERRELLAGLGIEGPGWQVPRHHVGDGAALHRVTQEQGLEGIVGKRLESPYRPGRRSSEWVKVRNRVSERLVIGGWTPGEGVRRGSFGALLVGYHDPAGTLRFAGAVGSGFTDRELERLLPALEQLERDENPFAASIGGPKHPGARFCDPKLVCEVEYTEWTHELTLRQPSYKGLVEGASPREVVLEPH